MVLRSLDLVLRCTSHGAERSQITRFGAHMHKMHIAWCQWHLVHWIWCSDTHRMVPKVLSSLDLVLTSTSHGAERSQFTGFAAQMHIAWYQEYSLHWIWCSDAHHMVPQVLSSLDLVLRCTSPGAKSTEFTGFGAHMHKMHIERCRWYSDH